MEDSPPSYDVVMNDLKQKLGPRPTASEMLDLVAGLSDSEMDVILENSKHEIQTALAREDIKVANATVAKALTSNETSQALKTAAANASGACVSIYSTFDKLSIELKGIDNHNDPPPEGPFVPRLKPLQEEYRQLVNASSTLALQIAAGSSRIDTVIIPMCDDKSIARELKLKKVNDLIKDLEKHQSDSKAISARYQSLKTKFSDFTKTFSNWGKTKGTQLTAKLRQLEKELKEMEDNLSSWESWRNGFLTVAGVGFTALGYLFSYPLAGVFGLIAAAISAVVLVVGLIGAGICALVAHFKQKRVEDRRKEIATLKAELAAHEGLQQNLVNLGKTSLESFNSNVDMIINIWSQAHSDLTNIKKYLEDGEKPSDKPDYMKIEFGKANGIYKSLSSYFIQYAEGIQTGKLPNAPPLYKP